MIRFIRDGEKRGNVLLITATALVWVLILILFKSYGYQETWRLWKVPVENPVFLDFRLIPGSAESFRNGFEPTVRNPGDPVGRIFNYPAFWRLFFHTGITQEDTVWISVLMIVLFFIGVLAFPGRLSVAGALVLLLVVFSPASMLLYERGNVDLIVFFLCALIVIALDYNALAATALIMFATAVKVFPIFGVLVLLQEKRSKFIWLTMGCLALLLGYVLETSKSMRAAWNLTMRGMEVSYGANVFFQRYAEAFSDILAVPVTDPILKYGPILLAVMLLLVAGVLGAMRAFPLESTSARNLAAFRMGAGIYVGTFLLGNNWDYRLVFLILVVPQLMVWLRDAASGRVNTAVLVALSAVLLTCWHFMFWFSPALAGMRELVFWVDEFINWLLLLTLGYLLAGSAPDWARDLFRLARPKPEAVRSV